jgi:hypothetical protein
VNSSNPKTDDGWLTELRVHPNGAKVCSTGKAAYTPHTFGLTFVRSGSENVVLLVDEQQPPTDTSGGEMTFEQSDKTLAALKMQVAGPTGRPAGDGADLEAQPRSGDDQRRWPTI